MVSPLPYKVWGNFFRKKALHGETNVFEKIYGRKFYIRTNDQIMKGGKLMVQRFQRSRQVVFPLIDPDLGYCYIIWKHLLHTMPLRLGISSIACLLFSKTFSGDLFFDVLIIGLFSIYVFMDQTHGDVS